MFETPVLLIVFNRPDVTRKVFDQIRKVKPLHLFIAADGPRPGHPADIRKCESTRAIIHEIDWECELRTLLRSENRGCGYGPAEAITWFFGHVEEGIILEDDCWPDESFFPFCAELLERYRANEAIAMVSGSNVVRRWKPGKQSYFFSVFGSIYGWATWRRAWAHFDYSATAWKTGEGKARVSETLGRQSFFRHYSNEFDLYFKEDRRDVWDFQWYFVRLHMGAKSIIPAVNMITNLGTGTEATHSFDADNPHLLVPAFKSAFPLKHAVLKVDQFYDWYVFEQFISPEKRTLWKKVVLKVIRIAIELN